MDALTSHEKSANESCTADSLLNCLCSFNLEGVDIKDEEEIEVLSVVLSEALGV